MATIELDREATIRLSEAIFGQLCRDYCKDYGVNKGSIWTMEQYIRKFPLTSDNADYIIKRLRALAESKQKVKHKQHRTTYKKRVKGDAG